MKVTVLGTGTPYPDVHQFGSAVLVEAGTNKILFDCGRGAVIRLSQVGLNPADVDRLFVTHLHADHVVGIPDLWLTGWLLGRKASLQVWGPPGITNMMQHLREAFRYDVEIRKSTDQLPSAGAEINAQEIEEGDVFDVGGIRVTAFAVDHGPVKPALGYRVDYSGHSVVISGDTKFSENLVKFARGTDCLIHSEWMVASSNSYAAIATLDSHPQKT